MSEERMNDSINKVDSFYIETRLHGCNYALCRFNMCNIIPNGKGKHCSFKKVSIDIHGGCSLREIKK